MLLIHLRKFIYFSLSIDLFGCPYIIYMMNYDKERVVAWNICLAQKRQNYGEFLKDGYRNYVRKNRYTGRFKIGLYVVDSEKFRKAY